MRITRSVATMMLGVLTFTGCSKQASTVQSTAAPIRTTAAPSTTTKPAARRTASTPVQRTRTAAPVGASRPSGRNVAPAPTRRTAATTAPAKTATPSTPKVVSEPVRKTNPPATTAATQPPVAAIGDAAHGKQLYMQSCSTCHGVAGQGSIGPSLQNEASRKNLAQTIAWIENPKPPMPKLYPGSLNDKDVLDIATYVESLK